MAFPLKVIAATGERFSDFSPFVPSINELGVVAFQAALVKGGSGIFTGRGDAITTVVDTTGREYSRFYSHPDINSQGVLSIYAEDTDGNCGVYIAIGNSLISVADTVGTFGKIGPLGPTMNNEGVVAFRAELKSGVSGVFTSHVGSRLVIVADTDKFSEFNGIPVVNNNNTVVFRAGLNNGTQGIYQMEGKVLSTVAETGERFLELGSFPSLNDKDAVVFTALQQDETYGVFKCSDQRIETIIDSKGPFESFRGALIKGSGSIIFYGTPRGGTLGIYRGADPVLDRILGIGDPLFDSKVVDFALNPVSYNDAGQIVLRVALEDRRQFIVLADLGLAKGLR